MQGSFVAGGTGTGAGALHRTGDEQPGGLESREGSEEMLILNLRD